MHNSKLLDLIKTFSKRELSRSMDFVSSPYFNKNDKVIALYQYIQQYAPRCVNPALQKERVFHHLFPDEAFNDKKLSYVMSDLLELLELFLSVEHFLEEDVILQKYYQLTEFTERSLEKHYRNIRSKTSKYQEQSPYRDAEYFYHEYLLYAADNLHFDRQKKHAYDESLQKAVDNLDLFYIAEKLRYSSEIVNRQHLVASEYKLRLLDEILLYLQANPGDNIPVIAIYYHIFLMLKDSNNESHYKKLIELLRAHSNELSDSEARDMYAYAVNYCIKMINDGNLRYFHELFELYKIMIDRKILFVDKYLSPWTYKNVVGTALRLGEYEWAKRFIENYKDFIHPDMRDNAYTYNLACLHFHQGDYDMAMKLLHNVEFTDIIYNLDSKAMLMRIFYETDEIEPLYSLCDSFTMYIKRNKLMSDHYRVHYLNFIKFVKELMKLHDKDYEGAFKLKLKLDQTRQVAYRKWLEEKLDAIISGKMKKKPIS